MPVTVLASPNFLRTSESIAIDVVVVHGFFETAISLPIKSRKTFSWLRNYFPYQQNKTRILVYKYDTHAIEFAGYGPGDWLSDVSTTLVHELVAERRLSNASSRPLIFLCQGVGGLLVKRALALSFSESAEATKHLRSIYSSTYAVIFAGTPHHGVKQDTINLLYPQQIENPSQFVVDILHGSEMLDRVNDLFSPLMNQFRIYNFWEQLKTNFGNDSIHIVERASAAPEWRGIERCSIWSDHARLLDFETSDDQGYKLILDALTRYIGESSGMIKTKWVVKRSMSENAASNQLDQHLGHSFEHNIISGGRVHFGNVNYYSTVNKIDSFNDGKESYLLGNTGPSNLNQLYFVPRCSSPQFTGRKLQSDMVKENLGSPRIPSEGSKRKIVVIYGLGGSGKTQFCLRFAESNRSRYWGVFWIDASTRENAEAGFALLGHEAGKGQTFAAGKHWLSQCSQPWLLIIDNADDQELDVSDFFPPGFNGHIIITTRNRNVPALHATAGQFHFGGMEPEEAITLLLKAAYPQHLSDEAVLQKRTLAASIAAELGYLAIALDQAGAAIRRKIHTIEKYLQFYLGCRDRLLKSSKQISSDETSIITTWEIPFRRIEIRPSIEHKDAVDLMGIFAFLHFDSISERIFHVSWLSSEYRPSSDPILPALLNLDSSRSEEAHTRLRRAIGVLCDYSIVEYDADREACSLHPVVHRWARNRLPDEEQFFYWLGCTIGLLVSCISPNLEASGRSFRRCLLPHVDSCIQVLKLHNPSFPESKERADQVERFAWLYAENGLWNSALSLQKRVIQYRVKTFGKAHDDTLKAQRSLSQIHWNLFEVEKAIGVQQRILIIRWWSRPAVSYWLSPLKPDYLGYCTALDDLTQTLWLAGLRELSKRTGERAVNGFLKRLGPEDPQTLTAMFNLARTYLHLGDLQEGHKLLVLVLRKRKRLFGPRHPDTLMTRNELGISFCVQRRCLAIAERLVVNVLEARKSVLGEEHAYTLWSVNDLSKIMCERGRPSQAVKVLEDILPIVRRTLGEEHVGMSMTKGNLARAYVLCERWNDAEELLRQMLTIIGDNHPDWIHSMSGYVHVQIQLGRLEEAEKNCKTMLDFIARTKKLAPDNPRTIAIAEQLAKVYISTGRDDLLPALTVQFPGMKYPKPDDRFAIIPIRGAFR